MTSAYHPQPNGLVERFNQILTDALMNKCHDDQHLWDQHMENVLFAYRKSVHKSMKMTPLFLMHLREANFHGCQPREGFMQTVCHCHNKFGTNLVLNGVVLAVSVCDIVF